MGGEAQDSHAELPRMFGRRVAGSPAPATRGGSPVLACRSRLEFAHELGLT